MAWLPFQKVFLFSNKNMGLCLYMPMDVAKSYHKIIHVLNKKYFFTCKWHTMAFQSTTQGFIESRNPCHQHTRYFCSQKILKRGDRIKGLKLRRINTYCSCHSTRGAAVHEVEKKSLACTAACLLRLPQYTRDSFFYLVSHVLWCRSTRDTAAPQIAVVGRI